MNKVVLQGKLTKLELEKESIKAEKITITDPNDPYSRAKGTFYPI